MRLPLLSRPAAPHTTRPPSVEALFLNHGDNANAYSVAFDADFERHLSERGVLAHSHFLGTTMAYFDPLCEDSDRNALIDEFLAAERARGTRNVGFWKISRPVAAALAERGFRIVGYGNEHDLQTDQLSLGGTAMRGVRRQVEKARRAGIVVTAAPVSPGELAALDRRWLASRPTLLGGARFEARRITRRPDKRRVEPYTTRVCARRSDTGELVGHAVLDHIYKDRQLTGVGLSVIRFDPEVDGVGSLLAYEGAHHVAREAGRPLTLALGESPLSVRPAQARADLSGDGDVAWSGALEAFFELLYARGNFLYNVRGITEWKRKWKGAQLSTTYIAVDARAPWRHVLAVLALAVVRGGGDARGDEPQRRPLSPRRVRRVRASAAEGGRLMKWTASFAAAEPLDGADTDGFGAFLEEIAGGDLIVRLDDSVESVEKIDDDGGYRAAIAPLRLPGLRVDAVAIIRVRRAENGISYTTEGVELAFGGAFRRVVEKLRFEVTAFTELAAAEGEVRASGDFSLALPLPRWWPIPDGAMAQGERLIRSIVEKDTRLTLERLRAEYEGRRAG